MINIRLLRNATLIIQIDGKQIMVDPMFGKKDTYDPVPWTSNGIRNPTIELPVTDEELEKIISETNAVILTHTHNDHWDEAAQRLIPKNMPIIGQPEDEEKLKEQGFENFHAVTDMLEFEDLSIIRTPARHGTGEIGEKMAPVSGFILQDDNHSIYIAGDTIWCNEVAEVINTYLLDFIVLNAGGAKFDEGDPITMTGEDVVEVCASTEAQKIICVHMEAINHCYLKRDTLRDMISAAGEEKRCIVPEDGETITLV